MALESRTGSPGIGWRRCYRLGILKVGVEPVGPVVQAGGDWCTFPSKGDRDHTGRGRISCLETGIPNPEISGHTPRI